MNRDMKDEFKFKTYEKYNKIKSIINSCETCEQINNVTRWLYTIHFFPIDYDQMNVIKQYKVIAFVTPIIDELYNMCNAKKRELV